MQTAPATGAPPCVARTEMVTSACAEIGLTGEALAESWNAPLDDAAAGGGAWGFGAGGAWGFGAGGGAGC